ncbi:uncharacterized protein LOC121836139 [Ixodes scapularis]|uniref:uncharacterized protein LOC121836139 n=1 Tax=Ixodes scapularis TaxID=6945 RepID=UPI001C38287C|nr:uncharacterized protein LOC121836139 [Ixodes scapularis]
MGRGTLGSLVRIHRTQPPEKIKLKLSKEKQKCLKWTVSTRVQKAARSPVAISDVVAAAIREARISESSTLLQPRAQRRRASEVPGGTTTHKVGCLLSVDAHDNEQKRHEKRTSKPRNILRVFCHTYGKRHVATKPAAREMYVQARGPHHGGAITPGSKGDGAIISRFLPKTSPPDCAAAAKQPQRATARHQASKHNGSHSPPSTSRTRRDTAGKSPKSTSDSKKGEKEIIYAAKSGAQKRASKAEKLFFDGCSSARASSPALRGRLRLDAARERSSRARSHSLFLPQSPSQAGKRRPLLLPLNRFDDRDIAKPWRDYAYAHRSAVQISIGVSG